MASERNVIELARTIAKISEGARDTETVGITAGSLRAICASLIEHHEALEPFIPLGALLLSEPSWSDDDVLVVDADEGGTLEHLRVGDFRRAASVHTKAKEPPL